jgi:hypothetical protein
MKISQSEIWNFIELIDQGEKGWSYSLHAGNVTIPKLSQKVLMALKNDQEYDTEMLPEIFTFREILWQPDVFKSAAQSLPGLRILKAYCEETADLFENNPSPTNTIYRALLMGISGHCDHAVTLIEGQVSEGTITRALGDFRRDTFPIIKFFIFHPQNRLDYYRDAVNRLNYAVKIMLTEFFGRYTELEDPYWEINYAKKSGAEKKSTSKETSPST